MRRRFLNLLPFVSLFAVTACDPAAPDAEAGMETAACIDGGCFDGLECLSDLCVAPEDSEGSGAGSDAASGGTSGGSAGSGGTSGGSSDPSTSSDPSGGGPGGDPSGDPTDPTGAGTTTGLPPDGCADVDVLFVVDNSGSMVEEQGRLAAAAPAFMDELMSITGSVDPHVMVINVEPSSHPCDFDCALFQTCNADPDYVCGETQEPTTCDDALGAGVGAASSMDDCGFTSGGRYIDGTQPNLDTALNCALGVGTGSGSGTELTMQAMVEALDGPQLTSQCNQGFLRDDALLLVVFVTDEDDDAADSSGNPAEWKVRLSDAKGGEQNIFVLGLFGDNEFATSLCLEEAEYSVRLSTFVGLWGNRGTTGSVCAPDYAPAFDELLGSVSAACGS